MEIIRDRIIVKFTQKEKEIINGFMDLSQKFSTLCKDNGFEIYCDACPFSTFCETFHNNADDVEELVNRQINL